MTTASAMKAGSTDPALLHPPPPDRAVTETFAVTALPSESVTWTMSVTLPVLPAAYAPLVALIVPPEAFVARVQAYPEPAPPLAEKLTLPPGGADALAGEMET